MRLLAARAHDAHEPHAHYADQRARDHERLEAEVDQPGHGARGVVRVYGAQHEVAGDRGAERDLGGFAVADLSDHDHVGVLAEDGAERVRERLFGLFVHLNLVHAREQELDRVLHRGDVARHVADALERGVDERRLARARGPGHQHDALRADEEPLELREVGLVHAEVAQLHVRAARIHDAHDDFLAAGERERRDAQIDAAAADLGHETAVLRQALLGDVEVREHLDARDDRALRPLGQALFLTQQTVHAQAHHELVALRLDVDVARALLDRAMQQPVRETDDRPALGLAHQLLDGLALVALGVRIHDHFVLALDDALNDLVHRAVEVVVALDGREELARGGEHRLDEHAGVEAEVLERRDVERVGHGHDQRVPAFDLDREREVPARHLLLDLREGQLVGRHHVEVEERDVELPLEQGEEVGLLDHAELEQRLAEHAAGLVLRCDGRVQLTGVEQVRLDQHLAESLVFTRHGELRAGEGIPVS